MDPKPVPITNNHNNGANVEARDAHFCLEKTLNSLSHIAIAYIALSKIVVFSVMVFSIPLYKTSLWLIFISNDVFARKLKKHIIKSCTFKVH
jgi:hypothetical protein